MANKTYDRDYFERWYRRGGIGGAQRLARKVALAVATAEYHLERPVRSVLDIGCGEGAWRAPLLKLRPKARYLGFAALGSHCWLSPALRGTTTALETPTP